MLMRLMLKLKLQYFGYLVWRVNSLEKALILGKIEGQRRGWQRMRWLDSITDSIGMNLSKFLEIVKDREAWSAAVYGVTKSWTLLSNWTTLSPIASEKLFSIFVTMILMMIIKENYTNASPTDCIKILSIANLFKLILLNSWQKAIWHCIMGTEHSCPDDFPHFGLYHQIFSFRDTK